MTVGQNKEFKHNFTDGVKRDIPPLDEARAQVGSGHPGNTTGYTLGRSGPALTESSPSPPFYR